MIASTCRERNSLGRAYLLRTFAFGFLMLGAQLLFVLANEVLLSAGVFMLLVAAVAVRHKRNHQILIFSMFIAVTGVELLISELLHLPYYFLLSKGAVPSVILAQCVAIYPLLLIRPLPQVRRFPILFSSKNLFVATALIAAALVHFGIKGTVVLGAGYDAYRENLAGGSGLIEYLLILFVLMASFRRGRHDNYLFALVLAFYVLKCAALGFRVQAIMGALLSVYVFLGTVSSRSIVILGVIGAGVGLVLGALKHTLDLDWAMLVMNGDYIQTAHNGALVSSTVGWDVLDLDPVECISVVFAWIFPRSMVVDAIPWAYPMSYVQQFARTPGGMLFGPYGYVVGGWVGVAAVGGLIAMLASTLRLSMYSPRSKRVAFYCGLVFFIFFPRWVLYDFGSYGVRSVVTWVAVAMLVGLAARRAKTRVRVDKGDICVRSA